MHSENFKCNTLRTPPTNIYMVLLKQHRRIKKHICTYTLVNTHLGEINTCPHTALTKTTTNNR